MKTTINTKLQTCFLNLKLKHYDFYKKIFQNIHDCYNITFNYHKTEKKVNSKIDIINFIESNPFIGYDIIDFVQNNKIHNVILQNDNTVIHLFLPIINNKIITPNLNRIDHIIKFMRKIANKNNFLTIYIIYSDQKKQLNNNVHCLYATHVNSGSCIPSKMITLWRSEELEKVLIHELIHFFEIDFTYLIGQNYFKQNYGLNNVKANEAYTDSLTIIIHTIYVAFYLNIDYMKLLNSEFNYVLYQAAKIFNYYNIANVNDINNKICQQTDVFSYFIIKASLLFNINEFIKFINKNIYFENRNNEFIELIDKSINCKLFNETITYFKHVNDKFKDDITLRMSHLQLE